MKIEKLIYSEYETKPNEWLLDECTFGGANLIVGKNATGKSRTLRVLRGLAALISEFNNLQWQEGKYYVEYNHNGKTYKYSLEYHDKEVVSEKLLIDNEIKLTRDQNGVGKIYAQQLSDMLQFEIENDKLAVVAKRDKLQHSYLDDLHNWAQGVALLEFGTSLGRDRMLMRVKIDEKDQAPEAKISIKDTEQVVHLFIQGENEFGDEFKNAILSDMKFIGYEIEDVGIDVISGVSLTRPGSIPALPSGVYVQESDLMSRTSQHSMSQGMFRALSSFIQINYGLLLKKSTCLLVDDIGEGLDFSRSSALVKRLIEKIQGSSIQLIMATNDRFIMNAVPLEYWIILLRNGGRVSNRNYRNSKEMFDKIQVIGLNNFDLFSTDYYKSE